MCCAITALLLAAIAAWRRGLRAVSGWNPPARFAAGLFAALALGTSSALAVKHFGHYAQRAGINERSVLAEILAQPICGGGNARQFVRLE